MSGIQFEGISKVFGDCVACSDISFSISRGEIHAIIGENGAGKSTLMKVLSGLYIPSNGRMWIDGKPYSPSSPRDAFSSNISVIHQHFVLADQLTAIENLYLSTSGFRSWFQTIDLEEVKVRTKKLLNEFSWNFDLDLRVADLSVGEQQRLEILKALLQDPEIIIFDEPTAVLTPQESVELMQFLLTLKSLGKTVILISHKLNEIKQVADRITILRQGRHVGTQAQKELSIEAMAELMIGHQPQKIKKTRSSSNQSLNLRLPFSDISFVGGEILGVAGIEGNGQSELIADVISQLRNLKIRYGDISEDRLRLSVFNDFTVLEHFLLRHSNKYSQSGVINFKKAKDDAQQLVRSWDVRPPDSLSKLLVDLSGGNQQKFIVGRELFDFPEFLIAAHPTRGVDLGAQKQIHQALRDFCQSGPSVLLVSSELSEVLELSDRYVILNDRKIHGPYLPGELTENEIGLRMASKRGGMNLVSRESTQTQNSITQGRD